MFASIEDMLAIMVRNSPHVASDILRSEYIRLHFEARRAILENRFGFERDDMRCWVSRS